MSSPDSKPPVPLALAAVALLFAAFLVVLVVQSLAPRRVAEFALTDRPHRSAPLPDGTVDTLTLDARSEAAWRFVDLDRGAVLALPDTASWDLAVRRFRIIARQGAADLGPVPFDSVRAAPVDGFTPLALGTDTLTPALERWYRYGFLSHVLSPGGRTYAVRTDRDRVAKLDILGYYCLGAAPGCLTFRYAFLPTPSAAR